MDMDSEPASTKISDLPPFPAFNYIITEEHKDNLENVLAQSTSLDEDMQIIVRDRSMGEPTSPISHAPLSCLPGYVPYMYLGGGGEGSAHLFQHRGDKLRACVVKITIRPLDTLRDDSEYVPIEVDILDHLRREKRVDCINIIDYAGFALNEPTLGRDCVFLGWANGGDLYTFARSYMKDNKPVPEDVVWRLMPQIFNGLAFLHEGFGTKYFRQTMEQVNHDPAQMWDTILHGDIKPENIFLHYPGSSPGDVVVKIADFGCAMRFEAGERACDRNCNAGTPNYAPPERPYFDHKGDVWAAAATVHYLCTGDDAVDVVAGEAEMEGWQDMNEASFLRRCPRRAHNVSKTPAERKALVKNGYGTESWQGVYSKGLQYVLAHGLCPEYRRRPGAVDMVSLIRKVGDALRAQEVSGLDWTSWMQCYV